jgi:hypothetical protein
VSIIGAFLFKLKKMILLRSDSQGVRKDTDRLKLLVKMLLYYIDDADTQIAKMVDHKGNLSVYWMRQPNQWEIEITKRAWTFLDSEIVEHFILSSREIKII